MELATEASDLLEVRDLQVAFPTKTGVVLAANNVSFKLVTVLGLVTLPISAWAFAKLADLRFPAPPMFAFAALPYVHHQQPPVKSPGTPTLIGPGANTRRHRASPMAGQ